MSEQDKRKPRADHERLAHETDEDRIEIDPTGPIGLVDEADWLDQQRVVPLEEEQSESAD